MSGLGAILADYFRFLGFRSVSAGVAKHWGGYFIVGVIITWLVGIGRAWDDPTASLFDRSGLGSLVYVFVLAAFIWLIGMPLRPARWSYSNVLMLVLMTAAPGLLYAIPVEMFLDESAARVVNLLFLLIVALWRMALFIRFLYITARLPPMATFLAAFLPTSAIVATLGAFGFMQAVAEGMGGTRTEAPVGAISSSVFIYLAMGAWLLLPLLCVLYIGLIIVRMREAQAGDASLNDEIAD